MRVDAYGSPLETDTITEINITGDISLYKNRDGTVLLEIQEDDFILDITDMELLYQGLDTALSNNWGVPAVREVEDD